MKQIMQSRSAATFVFCFLCLIVLAKMDALAEVPNPWRPLRVVDSCELDFNGDKNSDIALYVETSKGYEFILLLRSPDGFIAHRRLIVESGGFNLYYMVCHLESYVVQTPLADPDRKAKRISTPGAYVEFVRSEAASFAFVVKGGELAEVATSE